MKRLKLISAAVVMGLAFYSCDSNDDNNDPLSCDDAVSATLEAGVAFSAATDENYTDLCTDYKAALEAQIESCGDDTGNLQALIDDLGDCTIDNVNGTLSMNVGSAPIVFDIITVTTTGTTRHVHGEKSNTTYEIDFDVEVGETGANKINNFQLVLLGHTYTPLIPSAFGNDWGSNITVNSSTSLVGTFHGEVIDETETSVQDLLNGVIDIDF